MTDAREESEAKMTEAHDGMKLDAVHVRWPNGRMETFRGGSLMLTRDKHFAWVDIRDESLPRHTSGHARLIAMIPSECLIELEYVAAPAPTPESSGA